MMLKEITDKYNDDAPSITIRLYLTSQILIDRYMFDTVVAKFEKNAVDIHADIFTSPP
jgi:hypothetical protein